MGLRSNWYQIGNKACYIPKVSKFHVEKKMSMLTGLKVSSLTCKGLFYRTEHDAKGGTYATDFWRSWNTKWNIPTDRAQGVDKKMGSFV